MKRIGLKIDVETFRGTRLGVPKLIEGLQRHAARATFFFSLGPDCAGREQTRLSPGRFHDRLTRLYGLVLPAPDIGRRCAAIIREVRDAGFEVGVLAWNRVRWEKNVLAASNAWVESEMGRAVERFRELLGSPPMAHAAAGWRMNRHALRLTQRLGYAYASDCRGNGPFVPVIDGEIVLCPQVPTTLPTIDELLAGAATTPDEAVELVLAESARGAGDAVFTLRAESEGMRWPDSFGRLIGEWQSRGHEVVALRELIASRDLSCLPRHALLLGQVPGRSGPRLIQGAGFPGPP
ncbi:polysaccharide deacetylase family protein [Accumulibacter sp.]|uniref:polysaccharide deacetylase family protein n=1 Tax=Accumulibacter sp. TaxID=2053492 RepID=UPI0025CC68F1|nr:polysaccharide deacetylase family protein [Accumulibacter sp.]MCM8595626.1 polysaccharide deacetylase family protein [Accumulibacter sp.]MCM8627592.1 polysaccharide deacetylase family protein [Accumulibacter sp.]MDS4049773.1 polysaccharide deacetylase family protein [Accumulibacter sp.]